MTATDDALKHADAHAASFEATDLTAAPTRRLAVVACMDARLIPTRLLGLEPGDAHVIRNAGGIVTEDTIRSLAISQRRLGTTEVLLIQHTGCGLHGLDDGEFHAELEADAGVEPGWAAGGFRDLHASVRASVA